MLVLLPRFNVLRYKSILACTCEAHVTVVYNIGVVSNDSRVLQ